jgi:hypothetical protein
MWAELRRGLGRRNTGRDNGRGMGQRGAEEQGQPRSHERGYRAVWVRLLSLGGLVAAPVASGMASVSKCPTWGESIAKRGMERPFPGNGICRTMEAGAVHRIMLWHRNIGWLLEGEWAERMRGAGFFLPRCHERGYGFALRICA